MTDIKTCWRDLLRKTGKLFWANWFLFLKVALVFFALFLFVDLFFWSNTLLRQDIILTFSFSVFQMVYWAVAVVVCICFFWFLAALIRCIQAVDQGEPIGVLKAYGSSLAVLSPYIYVKFLYLFKVFLWSLCLVIPGMIFGFLYCLSGMAMLIGGKKGGEALTYSKKLIRSQLIESIASVAFFLMMVFSLGGIVIFLCDELVALFFFAGHVNIARLIDYMEIGIIINGMIYMAIFGYYLYRRLDSHFMKASMDKAKYI